MNGPPIRREPSGALAILGVTMADRQGVFDLWTEERRIAGIAPADPTMSSGWLALPPLVNFHAHADRAFTATSVRPRSLRDAIMRSNAQRAASSREAIRDRAMRFFLRSIDHGVGRIRTHTDVDRIVGMTSLDAILEARSILAACLSIDIVAFASAGNDLIDAAARARIVDAVRKGATLIGAVPASSVDPPRALDSVLDLAADLGVEVDLHLDEHLDAGTALIGRAVRGVIERRMEGRVAVSHVCALGAMIDGEARRILDGMARAEMTLVALPELNLYLQDRGHGTPPRRGLAPVTEARAAGVAVRLGTDNVRDWFYPHGDGDPLDTARVAALALHFDEPIELMPALCGGRCGLAVDDAADLLLIHASSLDDAVARRPAARVLIRDGCFLPSRT